MLRFFYFHGNLNSLSQNLPVLTAPSERDPLAMRDSFPFNGKATGYARGPIPEADFLRPGEDVTVGDKKGNLASRGDAWGSLLYRYEHLLIHKNVASETLSSFFATLSPEPFVK